MEWRCRHVLFQRSFSRFFAVEGATGSIVISVSADIPGCTDAAASNYNPDATVDDGSCCLANIVTIELNDSFGDGWTFGRRLGWFYPEWRLH